MIKIYLPIFFSFLALSNFSNAQTGPGGVGTTGTSGNVGLWLRADAITGTANNATLQTWPDASGRGSNAVQLTPASRPTYIQSSPFNNRPALRFNSGSGNVDDFMEVASTPILAGSNGGAADAFTFFAVVRMRNLTNTANRGILSKRTSTAASGTAYNFYFDDGGDQELSYGIANNTTLNGEDNGEDYDNDVNYIVGFRFDGNLNSNNRGAIYDGTEIYSFYEHNFSTFNDNNAPLTIGRLAGDANTFSNMDVAEIIHFNRRLNTAEFIILQNYLSAKYGIAIDSDDDVYSYDQTYGNEVAGIGRENSANQQTDARGTGIVQISNPNDLDNGNYLLWGHNGVALSQLSPNVPTAYLGTGQRLGRVWRATETGEVGNVTLAFDVEDLPSINSSNYTNLILLVDGNGNFNNATVIENPTFDPTTRLVSFSVSAGQLENGDYFTLGTVNATATPLPVTFISVEASNQGGKVALQWVTASEENNDFFTVERSKDGQSWEMVTTVQGAGNSSQPLGYQAHDQTPYNGTSYYRIKQTDLDGTTGYSKAVPVKVMPTGAGIMLFPNPVKDGKLHLTFAEDLPVRTLALTNMLGQVVYVQTIDTAAQVTVDLHAQSPGVYFVTLTGPGYRSVHKLVIE